MRILRGLARAAALVLILIATAPDSAAQAPGSIVQGRVTDALTSDTLAGATVRIEGTSLRASTDRDGRFRITGVPAGHQVLVVSYLGRKDKTIELVRGSSSAWISCRARACFTCTGAKANRDGRTITRAICCSSPSAPTARTAWT
jgi:hypothetical protein